MNNLPIQQNQTAIVEHIILRGDLSLLPPAEKTTYYKLICERIGLDPIHQPFKILKFRDGKEVLYCTREGAQQLNRLHSVSHRIVAREQINGAYVVTAQAYLPDNRQTESIGAVYVEGLKGDAFCNAIMKSETKAKRRCTLDLLGLGFLDETEIETVPNSHPLPVPIESVSDPVVPVPPAPVIHEEVVSKPSVPDQSVPAEKITVKQKTLILKLIKSHLFSDEEREKAKAFTQKASKAKASVFIDRLQALIAERLTTEKANKVVETPEKIRERALKLRIEADYSDDPVVFHKLTSEANRLFELADQIEEAGSN